MAKLSLENIPAERAVLGTILRDPALYWQHRDRLRAEVFAMPLHRRIVAAMHDLVDANREIAAPAILGRLPADGDVSPEGYLATLIVEEADPELASDLLDDLVETAARRDMYRFAEVLAKESTKDSTESAQVRLERAIATVRAIGERLVDVDGPRAAEVAVVEMIDELAWAYRHQRSSGMKWFLPEISRVVSSELEPGWMVGLLCDSGAGKTSMALQQAVFTASGANFRRPAPVLFLSGDQQPRDCYRQIASQELGIETAAMRYGQISEHDFIAVQERGRELAKLPLEFAKIGRPTVADLARKVQSFVRRRGKGLVIVDHAKRIAPADSRAGLSEQINQINGDLAALAHATECCFLILQQRNSNDEKRDDDRPYLGDIYGGRGAAESFDVVIALYVEELGLQKRLRAVKEGSERYDALVRRGEAVKGTAEIIGLKVRFGPRDRAERVVREARFTRLSSGREPELL